LLESKQWMNNRVTNTVSGKPLVHTCSSPD